MTQDICSECHRLPVVYYGMCASCATKDQERGLAQAAADNAAALVGAISPQEYDYIHGH